MALVASMQDDGDMQEEEEAPAPPPKWSRTRVAKSRKPESSTLQ